MMLPASHVCGLDLVRGEVSLPPAPTSALPFGRVGLQVHESYQRCCRVRSTALLPHKHINSTSNKILSSFLTHRPVDPPHANQPAWNENANINRGRLNSLHFNQLVAFRTKTCAVFVPHTPEKDYKFHQLVSSNAFIFSAVIILCTMHLCTTNVLRALNASTSLGPPPPPRNPSSVDFVPSPDPHVQTGYEGRCQGPKNKAG